MIPAAASAGAPSEPRDILPPVRRSWTSQTRVSRQPTDASLRWLLASDGRHPFCQFGTIHSCDKIVPYKHMSTNSLRRGSLTYVDAQRQNPSASASIRKHRAPRELRQRRSPQLDEDASFVAIDRVYRVSATKLGRSASAFHAPSCRRSLSTSVVPRLHHP
jgi:hypothetical protein